MRIACPPGEIEHAGFVNHRFGQIDLLRVRNDAGSIGDVHISHHGYVGNNFGDGGRNGDDDDNGDGQIACYDHSFGDFAEAD